ncbi:MAG: CotH kinase family protein, partial [Limisphaerales bacterium]
MIVRILFFGFILLAGTSRIGAAELIPTGAQWRYLKGFSDASNPTYLWRGVAFGDSAWAVGITPFFYGEPLAGTALDDMRGQYGSVFLRKTFNVANVAAEGNLELETLSDDGFIAWINGVEVARYNMPFGELPAAGSSAAALAEPIPWVTTVLTNTSELLNPGLNVLAVHAFNASLADSSDFVFDARLTSTGDPFPPFVLTTIPNVQALVRELNTIEVAFNEGVAGVDASDLLINGTPATEVDQVSPTQFVFTFPEPAPGTVQITWASNHGIVDLAPAANAFVANSWSYTLDPNAPMPEIMISEFMADNDNTLNDEDGDNSDWIEIFNPTEYTVDLNGWFLSNTTNNLALWRFPSVSISANSYLVVFASTKNITNPAAKLHTSFNLRKEGAYLALSDPQTNVVSAFAPAFPPQQGDVSYGRERSNPNLLGFFTNPTPGAPNTAGGPGFASDVKFSMPGRTFLSPFDLVLTTAHPNAVIRYVSGKTNLPTESSPIYTGPIRITNTVQIRARAFVPGLLPGDPQSESYIMLGTTVAGFKSDLPVVILHNYSSGAVPSTGEQFVMMHIFEPRNGVTSMTNAPDMTERARFRLRGSSTQGYPKGSFAFEVWNEFGDDKKISILGMPEESDWVFYAPNNFEPALIHNPLMHQLSRDVGRYSSRTRFVEVYLNTSGGAIQSANYNGIYVIEEKIKRGADRVDVDNLQPEHLTAPQVTGGYLLKIDRPDPNDANFSAAGQGALAYVDPKGAEIRSPARDPQELYIVGYINQFGSALNGPNFRHPTLGYAPYLDVPAAIDHHVLNVLANNVDALRLSTYLYKPREGKLTFGPLWDFDRALGSTDGRDANPSAWFGSGGTEYFTYTWWNRLFQDIDFWQKWIDRWEEWRRAELSTTNVNRLIDDLSGQVRNAQPREQAKWGITPRGGSYTAEISRLKNYVQTRSQWIDSQLVRPPLLNRTSGPVAAGNTVTLTGVDPIYYTLNGTDPRLSQGGISPSAVSYIGSITVNNNVRIFARAFKSGHALGPTSTARSPWSGAVTATLVVSTPQLAITELMYNPAEHSSNTYTNEDYEFIELQNTGTTTLALNGFAFTNGVDFKFTSGSLAPGAFGLLVKNRTVFESRYGTALPILGQYTNSLDNAGERVTLVGPMLEPVADVTYSDEWYPLTDGLGFSLVPRTGVTEPGAAAWRASTHTHGSPGVADPGPPSDFGVIISEALAHTDPPQSDFVELQNTSNAT